MIKPHEYIDIVLDTNVKNLKVDDIVNIDVKIENKSEWLLSNCLFRLNLDEDIFKLADENFDSCINEYGSIGRIQPNSILNISIPVRVKNLPEDLLSQMYCNINFNHGGKDVDFEDLNFTSKLYSIPFSHPNVFLREDFLYHIDKIEAFEDDILTHYVEIQNNSGINISNLRLINISNSKFEVVENSLRLNGMHQLYQTNLDNIYIREFDSGERLKIEFKTKVLKSIDDMNFRVAIEYTSRQYKITQKSENINVKMMYPLINQQSFTKSISKSEIFTGDIIEFRIEVENIGNSDAKNIIIKDQIDRAMEYIEDSTCLDAIKTPYNIIQKGILINTLRSKEKRVITYKAKAIKPSSEICAYASCEYSGTNGICATTIESNKIEMLVNGVLIGNNNIKKIFNTNHAQIGDIITVCIEINNNGNIDCESLKICDDISSSFEFIENSLRVDGKRMEEENVFKGVCIDRLLPQKSTTITYQIKILDLPKPNPIADKATLQYTYLQNSQVKSNTVYSNKAKLYVYKSNLYIVDREANIINERLIKYCNGGELISFSIILENRGNVGLENIYFKPNLPSELKMESISLKVNNSLYNKFVDDKILLPNLNVSQNMFIQFYIKHCHIKNIDMDVLMNFEYEFRDLERKNTYKNVEKLRETILVANPNLDFYKELSHKEIHTGEEFTQNIVIKNTGNIKYENIKIHINEQDFLKAIGEKCIVNGEDVLLKEVLEYKELDVGDEINIQLNYKQDDFNKHEEIIKESYLSATYTLFQREMKAVDMYSNKLKLKFIHPMLSIEGKCNYDVLFMGQKYTYVYKIHNSGNMDFDNIKIDINLPNNIDYISDTFRIGNNTKYMDDLCCTIDIGSLKSKQVTNIYFEFIAKETIDEKSVKIKSVIEAEYTALEEITSKKFDSKDMTLIIENKSLEIIKCTSHEYVQKGDKLKIQNILNNTGTVDFNNIVFIDNKNENLKFVKDSVYIDGENICNINPIDGIYIKKITSLENVLISYEYEYIPQRYTNNIIHFSEVEYSYKINNLKEIKEKQVSQNICIEGGMSTFKQFNVENKYVLEIDEPDICDIVSAYTDAKIDRMHEVNTISKQSIDNYNATGKKVIIKGTVLNRVEYLTKGLESSLYLIERQHPFTISINIPIDYYSEDIDFRVKCDDVFCKINNKRSLYISTLISIDGLI